METSAVPSIARLAAATAEDALSVSGLPPPTSTSLNVSPNHRYTLTPQSNNTTAEDSPLTYTSQLSSRSDIKTTSSSPGLTTMATAETSSLGKSVFYDLEDEPDLNLSNSYSGSTLENKVNAVKHLHNLQNKISKTKELIKKEQTSRDENVNEYLKLYSKADKQAAIRIKQVFEKKNEKSAKSMAQLQKKLDEYEKRKRDLELSGLAPGLGQYGNSSSHNSATDMNRAAGTNASSTAHSSGSSKSAQTVRAGFKHVREGVNKVISKPTDVMTSLMKGHHSGPSYKHHNKFGSDPDLSSISKESDRDSEISNTNKGRSLGREGQYGAAKSDHGSGGKGSIFSSNERTSSFDDKRKCLSEDGRNRSRINRSTEASESDATSDSVPPPPRITQTTASPPVMEQATHLMPNSPQRLPPNANRTIEDGANDTSTTEWNAVIQELTQHKEEVQDLREGMSKLRQQFHKEVEDLVYRLQEEGDRCAKLEDQINDLTELHQSQIEHIKNLVNDNEEQAHYQSEERVRDINDKLKMLETKVLNMETQQVQQQYLHIEGLDSTDARALLMKVITALITVVHVLFFILGTVINIVKPFVRTTSRILVTSIVVVIAVAIYYQQDNVVAVFHKFKHRTVIPTANTAKLD